MFQNDCISAAGYGCFAIGCALLMASVEGNLTQVTSYHCFCWQYSQTTSVRYVGGKGFSIDYVKIYFQLLHYNCYNLNRWSSQNLSLVVLYHLVELNSKLMCVYCTDLCKYTGRSWGTLVWPFLSRGFLSMCKLDCKWILRFVTENSIISFVLIKHKKCFISSS